MALDKLDHKNTLRAHFRCTNILQMAFLEGELKGLADANAHAAFGRNTAETCMFEVDIENRMKSFAEQGVFPERADVIQAMKNYILNIEEQYKHVEIIAMDMPEA